MMVIRFPETYQNLLRSEELEDIFNTSGLGDCAALPLNGVDLPRVYAMLENLKEDGATVIRNLQGEPTEVRLTEQTVQHALLLPMSPFTVKERRSHVNLSDIFQNPKNTGNRYTQMQHQGLANHIRVVQQMFKLTKQHRYTVRDLTLTYAMDEARLQQTNARKSWCQYFHQEILDSAKAKTHQKYLACGEYLNRIAYYLIGAIGDLPPLLMPSVTQETPTKRKRAKAPVQPKVPQPEEESSNSFHFRNQVRYGCEIRNTDRISTKEAIQGSHKAKARTEPK